MNIVPMHYGFSHSPNFKYLFHPIVSLRCQTTCSEGMANMLIRDSTLPACTLDTEGEYIIQAAAGRGPWFCCSGRREDKASIASSGPDWESIGVGYRRAAESSLPGPHCTCRHSDLALLKVGRSQSLWQGPHIYRVLSLHCCQERGPEQSSCKHQWLPSIEKTPFKKQPPQTPHGQDLSWSRVTAPELGARKPSLCCCTVFLGCRTSE